MTVLDSFCEECEVASREQIKGFDFAILIPLVLEFVVDWLRNCGDEDSVFDQIKERGFYVRYAVRRGIKLAASEEGEPIPKGGLKAGCELVLSQAVVMGEQKFGEALGELENRVPDFDGAWN